MNKRKTLWITPVVIWGCFTFWYTDFGGPLTDEEIDSGLAVLEAQGWDTDAGGKVEQFLRDDTGRQFVMVNNIDLNETPPPMQGFGESANAQDYLDHYMEHMYVQLLKRACHPVFFGSVVGPALDVEGIEGVDEWNSTGLIRYRSRRSFLEIILHPDMRARHDFKMAAMTKTIAYPVEPAINFGDLRIQLFLLLAMMTAFADILLFGRKTNS